ncbi:UDP-2,3-diacylglucosamine diphosphatase [Orbaceae bacterium ac157xtp]
MQRYFVADVHLNDNQPEITAGFKRFLTLLPANSELYILGDLFDYWIGDDLESELHLDIAQSLNALKQKNITCYFVHGNRDFLLGKQYAQLCHIKLLPAINLIADEYNKIICLHGDLLCTDDVTYQKFRKIMHNKFLQRLFLALPKFIRKGIANKLRDKSQHSNQQKKSYVMDVNQQTVEQLCQQYQANIMIHGHTHKLAIHQFNVDRKEIQRFVLGAWHDSFNYIHQTENGEFNIEQI